MRHFSLEQNPSKVLAANVRVLLPPISARGVTSAAAVPAMNGDPIVASDKKAIVETSAGKVRDYTRNGIYTFKGIPFGLTIEGAAFVNLDGLGRVMGRTPIF